jgi:hypothetical protein
MKNIILLLLWLGASYSTIGQSISISLPLDRAVYQRNSSDQASITIAGQCLTTTDPTYGYMIRYKVEQLNKSGSVISTITNWTDIISRPFAGIYRTSSTFSKGWYLLSVGQFNYTSPSTVSSSAATVSTAKFGVGEVIFTAGQSNIQGIPISSGANNMPPSVTAYDCVSAFNSNCYCKAVKYPASFMNIPSVSSYGDDGNYKIAPNGTRSPWYYQAWGKWIAEKETNGLPVVFFNSGFSGSFVKSWWESVTDSTVSSTARQGGLIVCDGNTDGGSDGTTGQPYIGFKSTLKFYGGLYGARGVVWHQGEADNEDNTSAANYQTRLQAVIAIVCKGLAKK